jgi:GntR family phosphonate transport system transcriptional regulator
MDAEPGWRAVPVRIIAEPTGIALWRQVADDLERAIGAGTFAAGTRLPSETEIAARFGVNRHTVRRALAALAGRGLVRAKRGSGTFVEMSRVPYRISARTRFSEIVGAAGRQAGGRLVGHAIEQASANIARQLEVEPGTKVARLEILRSVDRVPIAIGTTWLPVDRAPKAARDYRATRSLTRTLALAGIADYRRQSTRVSAAIVDGADAGRLGIAPGRPIIIVDSIDVTDGRPILTTHARFVADRIQLVVDS